MAEREESDMDGMEGVALFGIRGCCGMSNEKGEALCIKVKLCVLMSLEKYLNHYLCQCSLLFL